ncbi:MAG: hypothetical protein IJR85_07865 [Synergistaceae bacterium]|nr:hypothetical protein [Synergistaceae bacterium]
MPVFAVYDPFSAKAQAYNKKAEVLLKEIQVFADKIAAFNNPAFEAQLTNPPLTAIMWDRVYTKDKTLVFASAEKNKKFTASFFATTDPAYVFGKNIKVGASTKVLESYFGDTIKNMGETQGKRITLHGPIIDGVDGTYPVFAIVCENGIIAKITADSDLEKVRLRSCRRRPGISPTAK